ncbi:pirin family protein [Stenotrophobium rhamnosiphilum]|uniref:Quercetin 2,3-dioxygenase n=1 Tax=Stenotrophobium rhamnosiphilum TaxID=2029166 RepID=A0A2T5MFG3_9GAMM|nr:pirin family protein [Stenotrophobium rhamnosiphilum]PTU31306.1 quercetin 2,3-dioxygenase [Stenotrophobium rhamnosiphilum]
MITLRRSEDRGHAEHGWLDSYHTFSFSDYQDRRFMGFSDLRVINEDRIVPGTGFGTHGHRDMEIITYVLAGGVHHQDSTGGEGILRHGELQMMSAGSGVRHSEKNPSNSEHLHLLQIWIEPNELNVAPSYDQQALDADALRKGFVTVIAPKDEGAQFPIHQDARLLIAWPAEGQTLEKTLDAQRRYYLHVATGSVQLGTQRLVAGDAAMIDQETALSLTATAESEVLLFDLKP